MVTLSVAISNLFAESAPSCGALEKKKKPELKKPAPASITPSTELMSC